MFEGCPDYTATGSNYLNITNRATALGQDLKVSSASP
jgi:hypothetical protein